MNRAPYVVAIQNQETDIQLPHFLHIHHATCTLHFGQHTAEVTIEHHNEDNCIYISEHTAKQLHIPFGTFIHLYIMDNQLILAPLLGIFVEEQSLKQLDEQSERMLYFKSLCTTNPFLCAYTFLFSHKNINWETKTIQGFFFHENKWHTHTVPFPNVIYNRLPNRAYEGQADIQLAKKRLLSVPSIHFFNLDFLDKWAVYEILFKNEKTKLFIPESYLSPRIGVIERMLGAYEKVYFKPRTGSLGNGIFQVQYDATTHLYRSQFYKQNNIHTEHFSTLDELLTHMNTIISTKQSIVQAAVPLLTLENKKIDFRVHTNKNQFGRWQVTVIAAQVAHATEITTHTRRNGNVMPLDEIFSRITQQETVKKKLAEAAITMSETIDEHYDGKLGELGFDLGVSKDDQSVWLFEANAKPGRNIFHHPSFRTEERSTREAIYKYAHYLVQRHVMNYSKRKKSEIY